MGTAYRALGIQVTRDNEFLPALKEALKANRPALIEVMTELEYISYGHFVAGDRRSAGAVSPCRATSLE